MKNEKQKITIYKSGSFGISKIEANLVEIGKRDYAQYKDCVYIKYVRKGKRNPEGIILTYAPYMVVIEGHGHISPADPFGPVKVNQYESGSVEVKQTRFSCFDERYKSEFDQVISEYIQDKKVLIDVRNTINSNIVN